MPCDSPSVESDIDVCAPDLSDARLGCLFSTFQEAVIVTRL